ncbi:MAG: response regulator [Deltaproteobacteria bacterium]|nr:response regulator [Deltaproteobacteria bacterium]
MTKLFIMNGPEKGTTYVLDNDTITLGRVSSNDIQIKEKSISRHHLEIIRKGDHYFIKDLDSMNGTFIEGQLIRPGNEYLVDEGVPISIGKIVFSIGKECSEEIFSIQELGDLSDEFSNTAMVTAYKDRPMTEPKNLSLIYKVSNVLMQSRNIHEILEKMLDYIFELLTRIDRGVIILAAQDTGEITEVISRAPKKTHNQKKIFSSSIVNRVIQDGKAIIILDTFGQDEADLSISMEMMKVRSVMCVPLTSRSKIWGAIYVDSLNIPYGFRKEDLALLTSLSGPAAIAIENATLYANLEKIVEERTDNLLKTEKKLREGEDRFKAMFNNMSSGVIICESIDDGRDYMILNVNRACQKIEKIEQEQVLGKTFLDVFPEIRDTKIIQALNSVWKTGRPEQFKVTILKDDNLESWREYYIYKLPTGEIVAIFDDITDKKKAEEEQKALQEQLFASQKMETIGAFAGGTAHNFRNILQAISGNIEYLETIYCDAPGVKELAKNIYDSVEKGVDLINNLLHFSKRGGEPDLIDLDLSEVIIGTHGIIEKVFSKDIQITLDLEKDLFVKGNRSLLSQVFMNLFSNAKDAMPNGGKIMITAKRQNSNVTATVMDTGHGMDKETLDKIFDPFFTLKEVGKGTGLGLSTSLGIIEGHKGTIAVSSEPERGTEFKICLPYIKMKKVHTPTIRKTIITGAGQKILIVDDERSVLDSLTKLTKSLGYEPISTDKSIEAIKNYDSWAPDVVLMDRSMPEVDGITCIREIRKIDPDAKIVIVSGYEQSGANGIEEDIKDMIKGYLIKPCGAEELSLMLSHVLEV